MRIISGSIKGKKLFLPKDIFTRPLKDIVKEAIFNLIQHSNKFDLNIENTKVLDLFSGVGSFGLECLSRGSSYVTFVENYKEALKVLKKNIDHCNFKNKTTIVEEDIFTYGLKNVANKKFNLIYIDPPFKKKIKKLVDNILDQNLLIENGFIIIHRHKNEQEILSKSFNLIEERVYGNSKIIFGNYFLDK